MVYHGLINSRNNGGWKALHSLGSKSVYKYQEVPEGRSGKVKGSKFKGDIN